MLEDWDYDKNGSLNPDFVFPDSGKKVWWKCRVCGHSWMATLTNRTSGNTGCPVCAGRIVVTGINDLSSHYPELVELFDTDKNGGLTPFNTSYRYSHSLFWKCDKGHEWKTSIKTLNLHNSCCPYCHPDYYPKGYVKRMSSKNEND